MGSGSVKSEEYIIKYGGGEDIQDQLKRIDPNFKFDDKVEPWMRQPGPKPKIAFSTISTPGHPILKEPIPPSAAQASLHIRTFYKPGVVNKNVPVAPSITTDAQGKAQLPSFAGQTITIGIPAIGGSIGEGLDEEFPTYASRSWGFKLRPGLNVLDLYTRPGRAFFNGKEYRGPVDMVDIDPQVVLPHAPSMRRGRGGLRP